MVSLSGLRFVSRRMLVPSWLIILTSSGVGSVNARLGERMLSSSLVRMIQRFSTHMDGMCIALFLRRSQLLLAVQWWTVRRLTPVNSAISAFVRLVFMYRASACCIWFSFMFWSFVYFPILEA